MRLLLKIVTGLFVLLALLAAGCLVPGHLQIRRVEPALPSEAELRALLSVENGPVAVRYVVTSRQQLSDNVLGHTVFLVEWADGKLFMIDAGMDGAAAAKFARLMKKTLKAGEPEIHGSIAELLGADALQIEGVGLTHLHIDHSQGVVPFCAAREEGTRVFQTSWQAELHNVHTEEGASIVADSCLAPVRLGGETLQRVDGFPGLGVVALGGHTPGSTLFAAAVGERLWLFSGDITNSKADLLANRGKGFVYSYLLVPENTGRNEELRLWLTELDANEDMTVVVSHDLTDIQASGMAAYEE